MSISIIARTVKGLIILTRPFMSVLAGVATLISIFVASPKTFPTSSHLIFGGASLFLFAGSMLINDWFDLEIDRLNKPHRPIPSGMVTQNQALLFTIVCFSLGVITSVYANVQIGIWAFIFTLLSVAYSGGIKKVFLIGNVLVAALTSYPFIVGGILHGSFERVAIPVISTFFYILGREILKTVEDTKGDSVFGVKTISVRLGTTAALWVGIFSMLLAPILALGQYFLHINNLSFLYLMVLVIAIQLIMSVYLLKDEFSNLAGFLNYSMIVMLGVTISFAIGII